MIVVSNRRYLITAEEISRSFHELVRELQFSGFTVEVLHGGSLRASRFVRVGEHEVLLQAYGSLAEGRLNLTVDVYDRPGAHAPEAVCDTVALWLAKIVSRALGIGVNPRFVSPLVPREEGAVHVWRVPCG